MLADLGVASVETRFAVLSTAPLRLRRHHAARPLGVRRPLARRPHLYAIQYLGTGPNPRYNVRAVSLVTGKPVGGAIVDKREPDEEMNGAPWARARSADGAWAYTLYVKPNGTAFVHALDTASGALSASTCRGARP